MIGLDILWLSAVDCYFIFLDLTTLSVPSGHLLGCHLIG